VVEACDRRDRGQALLRAPRDRRARHSRAAWNDIRGRPVQGGSTITQQFVKNSIKANARTAARKVREASLAWRLEQVWTKDQILTAYLNTIYFGKRRYGVQQACRIYFGTARAPST